MQIDDAFPSAYVKSSDLNGGTRTLTIKEVKLEDLGQGADKKTKPVLFFEEAQKGMVLNVTNKNVIKDAYGPETSAWIGKPLEVFATKVEFKGQQTDGIRVRIPAPAPKADELLNDTVPF